MPTPHRERVAEFMRAAGQDAPDAPTVPDQETRILRAKLILEEALETVEALGVEVAVPGHSDAIWIDRDELRFEPREDGAVDVEGVVDGCADISVVTVGTLIAFGVDDEPILEEVDAANLRKFGPGSHRREDGKWIKPEDWTPPDIVGRLREQGWKEGSG